MSLSRYYNKLRRELYKPLSRLCLSQASTDYFGLRLRVPLMQGLGAGFLVPENRWMKDCLQIFLQQKPGMVVDIGVNIGLYLVMLRGLDRERDYLGFEPNAVCNHYTHELIRLNGFQNTRILPFALSDEKALRHFYIKRNADKMGSLNDYARFDDDDKFSIDVFTYPADEFFAILEPPAICAIKIDVEGAELEVLRGLETTLRRHRPFVFCEIWKLPDEQHPTYEVKKERFLGIHELLAQLDYRLLEVASQPGQPMREIAGLEDFRHCAGSDFILTHEADLPGLVQAFGKTTD